MTAGLAFDEVACVRGGRTLFKGIGFDLRAGDALLVTGPNGAGKSSLLRLAAGLLEAASGSVSVTGKVALGDEQHALDPAMPLGRALGFWARIDGGDASEALERVGLAGLVEVPVRMLSTGQRRRATLARVIAARADVWLLDEPANGLDAEAAGRLGETISAHRAGGGIVVAASHQPVDLPGARELVLGG